MVLYIKLRRLEETQTIIVKEIAVRFATDKPQTQKM